MQRSDSSTCSVARVPAVVGAVPIENAIGRVAVLLDLDDHIARADGVHAAAREKHPVARFYRHAMDMLFRVP